MRRNSAAEKSFAPNRARPRRVTPPPMLALALVGSGLLAISGCATSDDGSSSGAPAPDIAFVDVTREAGLAGFRHETGARGDFLLPEIMGAGAAFADVDGDGLLDILLVGGDVWPESASPHPPVLHLFVNVGNGKFADETDSWGLSDIHGYGQGLTAADYDADGDLDVYVTTIFENLLLRNDGGHFTDVAREAGVAGGREWSTSAAFFDADRDGRLDLIVANYVEWAPDRDLFCSLDGVQKTYCSPISYTGLKGRFYRGHSDGTFSDNTAVAGFGALRGKGLGVTILDFNSDGWPDVAIANDTEPDELYENRGDGTFVERGVLSGMAVDPAGNARAGMGIAAGVVDDTGRETIFVGNFSSQHMSVFRYEESGFFTDRGIASGIGQSTFSTLTFGVALFDVDLDADLDLLAANGHIHPDVAAVDPSTSFLQPPQLFLNERGGRFREHASGAGSVFADSLLARGVATGDYDLDGDSDLLITENGGTVRLWRNETRSSDSAGNSFLNLTLDSQSPAHGLGATIRVKTISGWQHRYVSSSSGYLTQSETAATFGLRSAETVDSLIVSWPSGRADVFTNVGANHHYHLTEGRTALNTLHTIH